MNNNYISAKRFAPSNTEKLSAKELQEQLNALVTNDIPERVETLSMFDVFGSDENKFIPSGSVTNVTVDGRTIALKDVLRGISNAVGGESANGKDLLELSKYFAYVSKSLKDSAQKADAVKDNNVRIRDNNIAVNQLTEDLRIQANHEYNISSDINGIIADEELRNELSAVKAANTELKAGQESLLSKVTNPMKPKKSSAANKSSSK